MNRPEFDLQVVLEALGWQLPPKRSGWYTVKCGYHEDRVKSCRINTDIGAVACMACDMKGDAIKVVEITEGMKYRDAVRRCEEITGTRSESVRGAGRSSRYVPSRSRNNKRDGTYVPPRLRAGASRGT